nr:protein BTN1 [Kwoniella shandongensis]KAA5528520.1 protein BTN1 [Kwoniella shandongensis]
MGVGANADGAQVHERQRQRRTLTNDHDDDVDSAEERDDDARSSLDTDDREEDIDEFIAANEGPSLVEGSTKHAGEKLFAAFMIFGLLNNVLYVIILSAALDLVSSTTPKGLVALFNIFPALLTKVVWPLVSNGKIQYARRIGFCTACSWLGIVTIALSTSLPPRLLGISLASLSSGLGELTFLQLTTTLPTRSTSKIALGAWSSGTGFAGIAGAGIWWLLRGLGVKKGLGLSSILPLFFPIIYKYLLPPFSHLKSSSSSDLPYQRLPTDFDSVPPSIFITPPSTDVIPRLSDSLPRRNSFDGGRRSPPPLNHDSKHSIGSGGQTRLTKNEKWTLLRPLVLRYMVPLCAVYVEEYVINSGVAPTLVFPLPTEGIWSRLFKSPRDYYPFWSLTYQTFVFLSRSSLSLGIPPLPLPLLPLPSIIQFLILSLLYLQSKHFLFSTAAYTPPSPSPNGGVDRSISFVFLLICMEGLCGGLGYVNTFWHVGREGEDDEEGEEGKRALEREFRIGAVGAADSTGILLASLISMPLEISLCNAQVEQGRTICRDM